MQPKKKHIVQEGQNIFDVAIELFGSISGIRNLIRNNPGLNIEPLYPGQELLYLPEVINKEVVNDYASRGYFSTTADTMTDAPVPPPAPDPNVVIIEMYGVDDVSIEAPGVYTVPPSTVEDGDGNTIATLSPGETYLDPPCPTFEPVTITDSADNVLYSVGSGAVQELPDAVAKNSAGTVIGTNLATQEIIVEDITVTQADGTEGDYEAGVNVVCEFPELVLLNSVDDLLETISSYPAFGKVFAPDSDVLRDGVPYGTVKAGGSINVISDTIVPTGIMYKRPFVSQRTSFRTGDVGWHVQNGTFNFAHPTNPETFQELDLAATDWFYTLKYNNAFGNKYRFTNSVGSEALDGKVNFSGAKTYTTGGGVNYYVIDHLTGLGFYVANLGNTATTVGTPANGSWNNAIDVAFAQRAANLAGFNDWFPLTAGMYESSVSRDVAIGDTLSLLKRGIVSGHNETFSWTADTNMTSTGFARYIRQGHLFEGITKGSTSITTIYVARVHY